MTWKRRTGINAGSATHTGSGSLVRNRSTKQAGREESGAEKMAQQMASKSPQLGVVGVGPPNRKVLDLHKGLRKAESAISIQARRGRIGLAAFLSKVKVPGYETPASRVFGLP